MEYTKDRHAKNLLQLLEQDNPCSCCPLNFDEILSIIHCDNASFIGKTIAYTCRRFVNFTGNYGCLCRVLGKQEAIKRTWIALEEGGYLEE